MLIRYEAIVQGIGMFNVIYPIVSSVHAEVASYARRGSLALEFLLKTKGNHMLSPWIQHKAFEITVASVLLKLEQLRAS